MKLVGIIDWSSHFENAALDWPNHRYCPKVTGPRGGRLSILRQMYLDGTFPPNYPVPVPIDETNHSYEEYFWEGGEIVSAIDCDYRSVCYYVTSGKAVVYDWVSGETFVLR